MCVSVCVSCVVSCCFLTNVTAKWFTLWNRRKVAAQLALRALVRLHCCGFCCHFHALRCIAAASCSAKLTAASQSCRLSSVYWKNYNFIVWRLDAEESVETKFAAIGLDVCERERENSAVSIFPRQETSKHTRRYALFLICWKKCAVRIKLQYLRLSSFRCIIVWMPSMWQNFRCFRNC